MRSLNLSNLLFIIVYNLFIGDVLFAQQTSHQNENTLTLQSVNCLVCVIGPTFQNCLDLAAEQSTYLSQIKNFPFPIKNVRNKKIYLSKLNEIHQSCLRKKVIMEEYRAPTTYQTYFGDIKPINSFESYLLRYKSILKAKNSLDIQTLHFKGDELGIELANQLIKRSLEGVKIRIIIDSLAPFIDRSNKIYFYNTYKMYRNLMAAGIIVYNFHCNNPTFDLWNEWKRYGGFSHNVLFWKRTHEKIWLQDMDFLILGGHNLANSYFTEWRDQDIYYENYGYPIEWSKNQFEKNIQYLKKRNSYVKNSDYCLNKNELGSDKFKEFHEKHTQTYLPTVSEQKFTDYLSRINTQARSSLESLKERVFREWKLLLTHSRPALKERNIEKVLIGLMNNAKNEIIISNCYFIPSEPLLQSLKMAIKRGVSIHLLTNGDSAQEKNAQIVSKLSSYHFFPLLAYGLAYKNPIQIYEWVGDKKRNLFHGKLMVIDRTWSIIGSYNIDYVSRDKNSELISTLEDKEVGEKLAKDFFEKDIKKANKIDLIQGLRRHYPKMRKDYYLIQIGKMLKYRL